jgi:hypothetical protein
VLVLAAGRANAHSLIAVLSRRSWRRAQRVTILGAEDPWANGGASTPLDDHLSRAASLLNAAGFEVEDLLLFSRGPRAAIETLDPRAFDGVVVWSDREDHANIADAWELLSHSALRASARPPGRWRMPRHRRRATRHRKGTEV